MKNSSRFVLLLTTLALAVFCCASALAQEMATLSGRITDPNGLPVPGVKVQAVNVNTNIVHSSETNEVGLYTIPSIPPGTYRVIVEKQGFVQIVKPGVELHVLDIIALNFALQIGSITQSVTVEAGAPLLNTTDATVSTVVDRQFAENLPMNGRSFQTLIQLTPGVVLTPSNPYDNGQFSVNGQRGDSNYWMVDGVSANVGIGTVANNVGNGISGANPALSVLGGTNSLVSIDALQEFRIQTSTFAPEFGRTPGAQISIVTRPGGNQWHGSAFDYLRNDILDANDWFANANHLPKPKERQNDFGGTFSGPVLKDRTFFFLSYEGLRLRLPRVAESLVPDMKARQNAVAPMQPFLNSFPLPTPNTPDDLNNEIAHFNASFSNSAKLDAYSLRIDHKLAKNLTLFGRYNYSPSTSSERGVHNGSLSTVTPSRITLQTATAGVTFTMSGKSVNELRFNYSRTKSESHTTIDGFGGAVPLTSLPFPNGFDASNGQLFVAFFAFAPYFGPFEGFQGHNLQRQINLVDNLTVQKGSHNLKFGVDFRRLSPVFGNLAYGQESVFCDVPSSTTGSPCFNAVFAGRGGNFLFHNLGTFAQDTWRINSVLTMTYGLRWDLDFVPSSDPPLAAVTGFNLNDLSGLSLAPAGTPQFQTTYGNLAPRLGIAYLLRPSRDWETVIRGGFGVFYDLATSEAGNFDALRYPFGAQSFSFGGTFPFSAAAATPPTIGVANVPKAGTFSADPHLELPYTLQWNVAIEQALGAQQTLSASYIGSVGRRLIQSAQIISPNPSFSQIVLVTNSASSDYGALQVQFQRRLSKGLQALASYTWSHSIDTASAGSVFGNTANALLPGVLNQNRGPSDFDIRNAFSAGVTYALPGRSANKVANWVVSGWSFQNVVQARSAGPVNVFNSSFSSLLNRTTLVRPDIVIGQPLYLFGAQYPGGRALNLAAFVNPPLDASGNPTRQGNLGRNALRAFGVWQWDLALHRDFPIRESLKLQFRAELFNVLNHPNFGPPLADLSNKTQFGLATQMFGQSLNGGSFGSNLGGGGFDPLYQIGGPRSMQFGLKVQF
jgi:hypothetical protein